MKKIFAAIFTSALLFLTACGDLDESSSSKLSLPSNSASTPLSSSTTAIAPGTTTTNQITTTKFTTTTKRDITVKTGEKSRKKTESPTATSAQTTQILKTNPTTPTKPILTDDIESQLIELFVQKHSVELQDIEDRHSIAINALDKESSDFEAYYLVRVRQINEKYANMGQTGSGTHNSELRVLENQRAGIVNRKNAENERYKKEKDALVQLISGEMQQYIDENFAVE